MAYTRFYLCNNQKSQKKKVVLSIFVYTTSLEHLRVEIINYVTGSRISFSFFKNKRNYLEILKLKKNSTPIGRHEREHLRVLNRFTRVKGIDSAFTILKLE